MQKSFKADIRELKAVITFLRDEVANYVDRKTLMMLSVSTEEIFVNILKYGYKNKRRAQDHLIDLTVLVDENQKQISLQFVDTGVPFNPLTKADPDITQPAAQRSIGGLGIFITKKVMDRIDYQYQNNQNILTLYKNF